jgi:hypothetical protein
MRYSSIFQGNSGGSNCLTQPIWIQPWLKEVGDKREVPLPPWQFFSWSLATPLQAFPGVGASLIICSIDATTTSIGKHIVLAPKRFKTHESAHHDGPICSLLWTEYKVSINHKTWEMLLSVPFMCKLFKLWLYVLSHTRRSPRRILRTRNM